jgi:hypothetical protein
MSEPDPAENVLPVGDSDSRSIPTRVIIADVMAVQDLTRRLRAVDYRYGGGRCHDVVMAALPAARALLDVPSTDQVRTGLLTAVADLHALAGWVSFDVGLLGDAQEQFAHALGLAGEVGDDELIAGVHYRLGRVFLHYNALSRASAEFELGERAAQRCGSALALSILYVNQAWARAKMGSRDDTTALVRRADEEFARAEHAASPAWASFFTATDLFGITGVVHTELALTVDPDYARLAIPALSTAIDGFNQDMTRSKAFCLIALATCHLLLDRVDDAVAAGNHAIELCRGLASTRTTARLRSLRNEATRRSSDPRARELVKRIDAFEQTGPGTGEPVMSRVTSISDHLRHHNSKFRPPGHGPG